MSLELILLSLVPLVGIAGAIYFLFKAVQAHQSTRWPIAPGEITSKEIKKILQNNGRWYYFPEIQYRYEINGTAYSGYRIHYGATKMVRDEEQASSLVPYEVGDVLPVFYHRDKPNLSVLEPGLRGHGLVIVLAFIFVTIAGSSVLYGTLQ